MKLRELSIASRQTSSLLPHCTDSSQGLPSAAVRTAFGTAEHLLALQRPEVRDEELRNRPLRASNFTSGDTQNATSS